MLPTSVGRQLDIAKLPKYKSQPIQRPLLGSQSLSPCPGGAVIARNARFYTSHSSTKCQCVDTFLSLADGTLSEKAPSEQEHCKERI